MLSLRGWVKPNHGGSDPQNARAPPALRTYCVAVAPLAFRVDAPGVETRVRWRFLLRVQLEARWLPSSVSAEPLRTCSCSAPLIQGGPLMLITNHELRQRVQRWLSSGALFAAPWTSWAGHARGIRCRVCRSPIREREIAYEVADGANGKVFVHRQCYLVWREESDPAGGRHA